MSILRTQDQVDGVEILRLIIETADYHRAMAELLEAKGTENTLLAVASERETYIQPFQSLLKELDELPAEPDPDKELMQAIGGKITKMLSRDADTALLEKCLHKEDELSELVNQAALKDRSLETKMLLNALAENIDQTKQAILALDVGKR